MPAMRAHRRRFFCRVGVAPHRIQRLLQSFTPRPDSGVVTRQYAHVLEAAILPSRQAQADPVTRRGVRSPPPLVSCAPWAGDARCRLSSSRVPESRCLPEACAHRRAEPEFLFLSMAWADCQRVVHRLVPKTCGYLRLGLRVFIFFPSGFPRWAACPCRAAPCCAIEKSF